MPVYDYEAREPTAACQRCRDGFEAVQSINDPKLDRCPYCGAPVRRVIGAPAIGHSKTDLAYRAKRAGFHSFKKVQKGEYEKLY